MRRILSAASAFVLAAGVALPLAASAQSSRLVVHVNAASSERLPLVMRAAQALKGAPGIADVSIDAAGGNVVAQFDGSTDDVLVALRDAGLTGSATSPSAVAVAGR